MSANKQQDSHRPPSDGGMAKEEFIRRNNYITAMSKTQETQ